jgi:hypothetical protein
MKNELKDKLELSWDYDEGFFGQLRQGKFVPELYQEFITLLREISFDDEELIEKDIVSYLWYIPSFMSWQSERVSSSISLEEYNLKRTEVENELERILGIP